MSPLKLNEKKGSQKKFLIFSGKGGVGKTSISTAMALHLSQNQGKRILLLSTDPAHNIADVLHVRSKKNNFSFGKNLQVIEIDTEEESQKYIKNVSKAMKEYVYPEQYSQVEKYLQLARMSPGLQEAALLDAIGNYLLAEADDFDHVIIDTAPTGHALRLMTLPSIMQNWMEILLDKKTKVNQLKEEWGGNVEGLNTAREIIQNRIAKYKKLMHLFTDSEQSSFYYIMNAECISFQETIRAVKSLKDYNIKVASLLINKVFTSEQLANMEESREKEQLEIIKDAKKQFKKIEIFQLPFMQNPMHGEAELLNFIRDVEF